VELCHCILTDHRARKHALLNTALPQNWFLMWLSRDRDTGTQRDQPHLGCFSGKGAIFINCILLGPLDSMEIRGP
jgi:hypothetical protein